MSTKHSTKSSAKVGCPGSPIIAHKTLCDYVDQFPEGEKKSRGGNARGCVILTQYLHRTGARHSRKSRAGKRKMDYEAFIVAMEQRRKWPAKRADAIWK